MGYTERKEFYKELEKERNSKLIVYVTGDRRSFETQIHQEVLNFFIKHLDLIANEEKISLYLYTRGGDTLAAWSLVNLIKQFCKEFEVIVPFKAHSAGTLICLGANNILMTKQATLGPIDPSVNTPLNPHIPGAPETLTLPVNVEAIKGYIEFVKKEFGLNDSKNLASVINTLTEKVHPIVLGEVYRARSQIKMLAGKLLKQQKMNYFQKKKIIGFLCSESGSHDYTINRVEAKNDLNLTIETPTLQIYNIIKNIFDDIQNELELTSVFEPVIILGENNTASYTCKRAIIESVAGGAHFFQTEGIINKVIQGMSPVIQNQRISEGWKYVS